MDTVKEEAGGVMLTVKASAPTLADGIKKMESFTRLVEKLSEGDVCNRIIRLGIFAELG